MRRRLRLGCGCGCLLALVAAVTLLVTTLGHTGHPASAPALPHMPSGLSAHWATPWPSHR